MWLTPQLVFNGIITGLVYGLLAMGLVLVYRSTKVINFAVGNMGLLGSYVLALLVLNYRIPFWIAVVLALGVGLLYGAIIDLTVIRRLFDAPRVVLVVATVGVAQLSLALQQLLPAIDAAADRYPVAIGKTWDGVLGGIELTEAQLVVGSATPFGALALGYVLTRRSSAGLRVRLRLLRNSSVTRTWVVVTISSMALAAVLMYVLRAGPTTASTIRVQGSQLSILVMVPVVALALGLVLNRTMFGKSIAAASDDPDLAQLSAVNPRAVSTFVWATAGLLSTLSMIALSGGGSVAGLSNIGPLTLGRALVVAVVAGLVSFPRCVIVGIALGITESLVRFNFFDQPGLTDFFILVAVVCVLVFRGQVRHDSESFSFVPKIRPVLRDPGQIWWIRHLTALLLGAALLAAVLLPLVVSRPSRHLLYASIFCFAICAASLTVTTGWSGLLSLSQMSFAGIGALLAAGFHRGINIDLWGIDLRLWGAPFLVAIAIGAVLTAPIAALIGVTALRVRGPMLAIATFVFAIAAQQYLYRRPVLSGGNRTSVPFRRGTFFGLDLDSQRTYYYLCLAVLVVVVGVLWSLRDSGVGRTTIAVRDNADNAATYAVSPVRTRLIAFALSGAIAALGGGLLAGLVQSVPYTERFFLVDDSLRLVGIVVVGGIGSVLGSILGSVWVVGLPAFFEGNDLIGLFTSSIGLLVIIMYLPGGLAQVGHNVHSAALRWYRARHSPTTQPDPPRPTFQRPVTPAVPAGPETVLATSGLSVNFGGNEALRGVDLSVHRNEVVGLIGTNGAGKSTLMNAVGGLLDSRGTVHLLGADISRLKPTDRARAGLGRTFQAATLFPELTVRETIQVALEARSRTRLLPTLLFLPSARYTERQRRARADDLIDFLKLGPYADNFIGELSTGTRRIVGLCGLLALDARVLCLDEPTAGLAQRETEAVGPLLTELNRELGTSMLIIEHDMGLILSVSDRVYCLEAGTIIAEGSPDEVRTDPAVIASYLGTDARAIERSNMGFDSE